MPYIPNTKIKQRNSCFHPSSSPFLSFLSILFATGFCEFLLQTKHTQTQCTYIHIVHVTILIVTLMQPTVTWVENLSEGLSRSDRPDNMNCLITHYKVYDKYFSSTLGLFFFPVVQRFAVVCFRLDISLVFPGSQTVQSI